MPEFTQLNISGYRGQPVPHTFMRQAPEARHLAIVFPGMGYTAAMPVLYYPDQLLAARGADVLRLEYNYTRPEFRNAPADDRQQWFRTDIVAASRLGLAQGPYERIILIGKSIGTLALGQLLELEPELRQADYLWLTPLLRQQDLYQQILRQPHRALFVIGSADAEYDPELLGAVERATGGSSVVIENANHSLEIAGDLLQSIAAMHRIMAAVESFLGT